MDEIDDNSVRHIAMYLETSEISNLAQTGARFGLPQSGRKHSLMDQVLCERILAITTAKTPARVLMSLEKPKLFATRSNMNIVASFGVLWLALHFFASQASFGESRKSVVVIETSLTKWQGAIACTLGPALLLLICAAVKDHLTLSQGFLAVHAGLACLGLYVIGLSLEVTSCYIFSIVCFGVGMQEDGMQDIGRSLGGIRGWATFPYCLLIITPTLFVVSWSMSDAWAYSNGSKCAIAAHIIAHKGFGMTIAQSAGISILCQFLFPILLMVTEKLAEGACLESPDIILAADDIMPYDDVLMCGTWTTRPPSCANPEWPEAASLWSKDLMPPLPVCPSEPPMYVYFICYFVLFLGFVYHLHIVFS